MIKTLKKFAKKHDALHIRHPRDEEYPCNISISNSTGRLVLILCYSPNSFDYEGVFFESMKSCLSLFLTHCKNNNIQTIKSNSVKFILDD